MSAITQPQHIEALGSESRSVGILIFALPFLQFVKLQIVGVLFGSDLLFIAAFIYLAFAGKIKLQTPLSKKFVILGSLWFVSQLVTDIVRQTAFQDYARGWSKILLTLINFCVLYVLLYGRPRRLVLYGWGLAVGSLLMSFISPDDIVALDPWKFGLSYPITLAVFLLASHPKCRGNWPVLLAIAMGTIDILADTRSRGGICLVAAMYLVTAAVWKRKGSPPITVRLKTVVIAALICILAGASIIGVYQYAVEAGLLGDQAKQRYELQASGRFGLLLGGRSDLLGALAAIHDSPILGHGSWARDPAYVLLDLEAMAQMGYENTSAMEYELVSGGFRIPAHSYLLEAWVESGAVGALFWGWVLAMTLRALWSFYPARFTFAPLAAFAAFMLLWDIVGSPYGAEARFFVPYYVVMLMTCLGDTTVKTAEALRPVRGTKNPARFPRPVRRANPLPRNA